MRISSLTLTGFRCFGPDTQHVVLDDLSALVGANGCGKSAVLQALSRLFGTTKAERSLVRSDFHLPADQSWDQVKETSLCLEARLDFPELAEDTPPDDPAAACFRHMTVQAPGTVPYCRIRLDGTWRQSNLPEGDIDERLLWVTSPTGTTPERTSTVQNHERSRIHVHYIPASRDPARQIRQVSGSMLHTLLRAIEWSAPTRETITTASAEIRDAFAAEAGVKSIVDAIERSWTNLHDAPSHQHIAIRPVSKRLEDLLRHVEATFSPSPTDKEDTLEVLSDGQRSLFYLSLVTALLDIQEKVGDATDQSISRDALTPPILNVLAVEEPENHIAPHYLGRIMAVLRRVGGSPRSQVVLASHSPSILARVEPQEVRYVRTQMPARTAVVRQITLPDASDDAHVFVREAVRAYPELYFSRFVLFGEGDSEEIVLPRIARAMDIPLDDSFVSVVPLGGRHVNHFWRLLDQLTIPHATLLDLDRERQGGGWGRIKYALKQLLLLGHPAAELLSVGTGTKRSVMTAGALEKMHTWDPTDTDLFKPWLARLAKYRVFFSEPLDLDFSMLQAFPAEYKQTAEDASGPNIPEDKEEYSEALQGAIRAVLKESNTGGASYSDTEQGEFFWYRYLFLGRSKPSTHLAALAQISTDDLRNNAPSSLTGLIELLRDVLWPQPEQEPDDGPP